MRFGEMQVVTVSDRVEVPSKTGGVTRPISYEVCFVAHPEGRKSHLIEYGMTLRMRRYEFDIPTVLISPRGSRIGTPVGTFAFKGGLRKSVRNVDTGEVIAQGFFLSWEKIMRSIAHRVAEDARARDNRRGR